MSTPPLPAGYALDQSAPPLPSGYALDEPAKPGMLDKANELAGKTLSAAGLPTSIENIPDWVRNLFGKKKDEPLKLGSLADQPVVQAIKTAAQNPTQENLVGAVPVVGPAAVAMSKDVRNHNIAGAGATLLGTVGGVAAGNEVAPALDARSALKNAKVNLPEGSGVAERLYQSALKPSPATFSPAEVQQMVKTGLENKLPISAEGVGKLNGLVSDLHKAVQAQIDAGSDSGATVNKYAVTSRLSKTAKQFATQVNPEADLAGVSEAGNEFLRNQPTEIPASDAQKLKTGTYQQLGNRAYGELRSSTVEAQKSLARGIKEELEAQFPEIKELNAYQSKLYDLQPVLERAVNRIDNHDIISLGSKVSAGAGAALGGAPGAVAGSLLEKILGMPTVKSKIAIALDAASKGKPGMRLGPSSGAARVAALSAALANANAQGDEQQPAP